MSKTITIDGKTIPFEDGQTIMDAAMAADVYIPHLCHQPEYPTRQLQALYGKGKRAQLFRLHLSGNGRTRGS